MVNGGADSFRERKKWEEEDEEEGEVSKAKKDVF